MQVAEPTNRHDCSAEDKILAISALNQEIHSYDWSCRCQAMGDSMSVVLSVSASTAVFVYVIGKSSLVQEASEWH